MSDNAFADLGGGSGTIKPRSNAFADLGGAKQTEIREATAEDRIEAHQAGVWQGASYLAGALPDAVANLYKLGKAGVGSLYNLATGHPAPQALEAGDAFPVSRSIAEALNKIEGPKWLMGADRRLTPTTINRPDNQASRYIAAISGILPGAATGGAGIAGTAKGVTAAAAPAIVGQSIADAPPFKGDEPWVESANNAAAITAQLATGQIAPALSAITKPLLRAGASPQVIAQAIKRFRAATGEAPSWGQATDSQNVQGLETLASSGFGGMTPFENLRARQQAGGAANLDSLVTALQGARTKEEAGHLIQGAIKNWQERTVGIGGPDNPNNSSIWAGLQRGANELVPPGTRVQPAASVPSFRRAANPINDPEASGLEALFGRGFAGRMAEGLQEAAKGTSGQEASPPRPIIGRIIGPEGDPLQIGMTAEGVAIPGKPEGIKYETFRRARSEVGREAFPENPVNTLLTPPDQAALRSGYFNMNQDLIAALRDAPKAKNAQLRADRYYSGQQERAQQLSRFTDTKIPEQAASQFSSAIRNQSTTTLRQLRRSMTPEQRASAAGYAIDDLGRPAPGQRTAENDGFSFSRFATEYNRLEPNVRDELFAGFERSGATRKALDNLASVAETIKSSSAPLRSTSGTGPYNEGTHEALGPIAAVATGHAGAAAALLTIPLARAGAARFMMTNPNFVNWLASSSRVLPKQLPAHLQALDNLIVRESDPQTKQAMAAYRESVRAEFGE